MERPPLTREQHVDYCQWAEELEAMLFDAGNLLSATYTSSSALGRLIERVHAKTSRGFWGVLKLNAQEEYGTIPDEELSPRRTATAPGGSSAPNRFAFEWPTRQRTPQWMSLELHRQLAAELKRHRDKASEVLKSYANAYGKSELAVKRLRQIVTGLDELRYALQAQLHYECRSQMSWDDLMHVYGAGRLGGAA